MKLTLTFICGVFLLSFLGVSQGSAASCTSNPKNLISNCGFETGTFAGWNVSGNDVPGQLNVLYGVEGVDPINGIGPNSGNYQVFVADLASNATTLSQTIATTAATAYKITFDLAQDTLAASGYPNTLSVLFNGVSIFSQTNVPVEGYTQYTVYGASTGTSSVLSISLGNGVGEFLLDDVVVTVEPEPSTLLMMLGSGMLLAGILRRRCVKTVI